LNDTLILEIRDNGIGFNPEKRSNAGLGLTSMAERAMAVGGELEIESRAGIGTTIWTRIPYEYGTEDDETS